MTPRRNAWCGEEDLSGLLCYVGCLGDPDPPFDQECEELIPGKCLTEEELERIQPGATVQSGTGSPHAVYFLVTWRQFCAPDEQKTSYKSAPVLTPLPSRRQTTAARLQRWVFSASKERLTSIPEA